MKEISLYYLRDKLRHSNAIVIFGIFLLMFSSIITVSTGFPIILKFINEKVFYPSFIKAKIEKLNVGTQINNFTIEIGQPSFVKSIGNDGKYKEYVFINKLFYLDAITDTNNNVVQYAVTTRDKSFSPAFYSPTYDTDNHKYNVQLGKTKFSDLPELPFCIDGCVGAHTWYYFETHYLGNPSNYQFYAFGLNMGGFDNSGEDAISRFAEVSHNTSCNSNKTDITEINLNNKFSNPFGSVEKLREDLVINTYLVTAPFQSIIPNFNGVGGIGPDYNDVRIY